MNKKEMRAVEVKEFIKNVIYVDAEILMAYLKKKGYNVSIATTKRDLNSVGYKIPKSPIKVTNNSQLLGTVNYFQAKANLAVPVIDRRLRAFYAGIELNKEDIEFDEYVAVKIDKKSGYPYSYKNTLLSAKALKYTMWMSREIDEWANKTVDAFFNSEKDGFYHKDYDKDRLIRDCRDRYISVIFGKVMKNSPNEDGWFASKHYAILEKVEHIFGNQYRSYFEGTKKYPNSDRLRDLKAKVLEYFIAKKFTKLHKEIDIIYAYGGYVSDIFMYKFRELIQGDINKDIEYVDFSTEEGQKLELKFMEQWIDG